MYFTNFCRISTGDNDVVPIFSNVAHACKQISWFNVVDEHVVLGALPIWWQFDELKRLGVGAVVNLVEEFGGHLTQAGELQKRQWPELYLPTPDYLQPTLTDIERAVAFIEQNASQNVTTLVHCKVAICES